MEDKSTSMLTGAKESPESTPLHPDTDLKSSSKPRDSSTAAPASKRSLPKRAASATSSPLPSRESSPVRPPLKANSSSARSTGPGRSRKNSVQEVSPSRAANANPPSAAATQRALSAASIPSLPPVSSEPIIKAPNPQKPTVHNEIKETPRWPISPRLRSPPPINKHSSVQSQPRKSEQDTPTINVPRGTLGTESQEGDQATTDSEVDDSFITSGMRTPARGVSGSTLETVQEISQPNTPGSGLHLDGLIEQSQNARPTEQDLDNAFNKSLKSKGSVVGENGSGSESAGKGEPKMRAASAAPAASSRMNPPPSKSYSTGAGVGRGKASGDQSARNMTVETETVSSIPQVAVGTGGGNNGSIRTKPSTETIRPKKEKKKAMRKAPSVTSGAASSKAEIFEAKVASAVDEANSSDSEETFVYESNPPDNNDRPRRFHSRTPSVTSMASQADRSNGVRSLLDGGHSVAMKKSMKFANSYNSNGPEPTTAEDDGKGTVRSNMGTGRGTTHHHHIGRWGRNGGNGHASLFDNESPFPNVAKSKLAGNGNGRNTSQPSSPRMASKMSLGGKKQSPISSGYDMDDGADDERTPLISTIRSGRSARARRPMSSMRQLEHQAARQNRSFLARFAGCLLLGFMIITVISGAIGFMFASTQPLSEVKIVALKNVLASEQEIILDMKVTARNTNLVIVTIDTADLLVFAKSKYAGTDSEWWSKPPNRSLERRSKQKRDWWDDDEEDDDPTTNPNLEIGEVYELNSPLTFDGSPFHHLHATSTGQIRINHPGNKTQPRGSERWGRVVQHEFDLLVRGTLKYTLPLSSRVRTVGVEGRITVKPNAADQDPDNLHLIPDLTG